MTCRSCQTETILAELHAYNGRCERCWVNGVVATGLRGPDNVGRNGVRNYRAENRDEPAAGDGAKKMVIPWLK